MHPFSTRLLAFGLVVLLSLSGLSAQDATTTKKSHAKVDLSKLEHPVTACLWEISGMDLTTKSYLFGTCHVSDKRITTLHPRAQKAFEEAGAVYTEVPLDLASQIKQSKLFVRKDGKEVSEAIGKDLTKKVNSELHAINPAFNISSPPFNQFKTWAIAVMLPALKVQLAGGQPLDIQLYQRATKAGKKVGGLESFDGQIKAFNELSEEEALIVLELSLNDLKKMSKGDRDPIKELIEIYLTQTPEKIGKFIADEMKNSDTEHKELGARLMKGLLDDRNERMVDSISKILSSKSNKGNFFAVGAAHYTGKNAVQILLEAKGYTVKPAFH